MNKQSDIQEPTVAHNVIALMQDVIKWKPQIERALRGLEDLYSFDGIVYSVLQNRLHFYEFGECCVFMELDTFENCKVYHCFLACGDMEEIMYAEKHINEVAKRLGCKYMSIAGRTGWPRVLRNAGWEHKLSVLYKETY